MAGISHDLLYALRRMRKSPGFSVFVVLLLALGIGLNGAIFSLLDAFLLRPLPVKNPQELVRLVLVEPHLGPRSYFTYNVYRTLAGRSSTLREVFGSADLHVAVRDRTGARRVRCQVVTGGYFTALGVRPLYGRILTAVDEFTPSSAPPAVLSYPYWQGQFHGDPAVIGGTLILQDHPFTIAGVMPRAFNGLRTESTPDIRVPLIAAEQLETDPDSNSYRKLSYEIAARLRSGVSRERARAEIVSLVNAALDEEFGGKPERGTWSIGPLDLEPVQRGVSLLRPKVAVSLELLTSGLGLVLLIICANVGGMLLARASARRAEVALRLALGATRARLLREQITETFLMTALGGVTGLFVAFLATPFVVRALPALRDLDATTMTLSVNVTPDLRQLLFSMALCLLPALVAGLPAAIHAARVDLHSALRTARATARQPLRWALVAIQAAMCTLLVAGAGLLVSTFRHLRALDPGFDVAHVVTFCADPGMLKYNADQTRNLESGLLALVREIPGVESAAIASRGLMRGTGFKTTVAPAGQKAPSSDFMNASLNSVSPEYFDTMGMRFLEGRDFRIDEPKTTPEPVVVNSAFVRRFFPAGDPVGQKFGIGVEKTVPASYQIIGVISDAKYRSLREVNPPTMYRRRSAEDFIWPFILHVRTRSRPESVIEPAEKALARIDPRLPFYEIRTLAEEVDASLWTERLLARLATAFSIVSAILAAMGIYGALAYAIAQGRRELGIRVALGASPADVLRLLSTRPLVFAGTGVAAGSAGFVAAASAFRNVLYGVSPTDPSATVSAAALVVLVALAATLAAARPALRMDPAVALREE